MGPRYAIRCRAGTFFSPQGWNQSVASAVLFVSPEVAREAQKIYCRGFTSTIVTVFFHGSWPLSSGNDS